MNLDIATLTGSNKAIVAAIMSVLAVIDQIFGISFPGISEAWVTSLIVLLTPFLVWLIPNRPQAA